MWVSLHTCIILNKDSDDVSALHVQLHGFSLLAHLVPKGACMF